LLSANLRAKRNNMIQKGIMNKAIPMSGQVGGLSDKKKQILTLEPKLLLKPVQNHHRGLREIALYEIVKSIKSIISDDYIDRWGLIDAGSTFNQICKNVMFNVSRCAFRVWYSEMKHLHSLSEFLVDYYGVITNENESDYSQNDMNSFQSIPPSPPQSYMILSDETSSFHKPCVIDLKIGTFTYEPDAKPSKKESQRKKYPQQEEFGFRVVGLQVYDPKHAEACASGFRRVDKLGGRSLKNRDSIVQTMKMFFKIETQSDLYQRKNTVLAFLAKLKKLSDWFRENNKFAFYASSLLFIYDGCEDTFDSRCIALKMIDFAHVRKDSGLDEGCLHGLNNISSILEEVLQSE
jgi:hypothetical protein